MSDSTFCPLPWNSINTRNNGNLRVCCNANSYTENKGILKKKDGTPFNAGKDNFDDARNSDLLKEIRVDMLAGKWNKECTRCKNEEEAGLLSRRMYENSNYPKIKKIAIENTLTDGTINASTIPVEYVDIRYGNFCNLKCRMCGPSDSHMWIPDFHKMGIKKYNETDKVVNIISNEHGDPIIDYSYDWYSNTDHFNQEILKVISNIKKFYIVGGEPLYIKEHYDFLELIASTPYAKNIYLEYNTNLTNLPKHTINLWKKFKGVLIGASIDGFGNVLEYQRTPANWKLLYKNLKKINEFIKGADPIRYDLSVPYDKYTAAGWLAYTVTTINVLHLPDFIKWKIEESELDSFGVTTKPVITHHMCHSPSHYNVKSLHPDIKSLVELKYNEFINYAEQNYDELIYQNIKKTLLSIVKFMNSNAILGGWEKFIEHTVELDRVRNQNILNAVPEYKEYFNAN